MYDSGGGHLDHYWGPQAEDNSMYSVELEEAAECWHSHLCVHIGNKQCEVALHRLQWGVSI